MTISVVASSSATASAGIATVTKPAGTADGDLMVAFHAGDFECLYADLTAPVGWTLRGGLDSGSGKSPVKVFTKTAASEGSSYGFGISNTSGQEGACIITTLRGVTTSISDWVFSFSFDASTSTTRTAPSVTGTGELLLSYAMISQNGAAATGSGGIPSGMTECDDTNTGYIAAALAYLVAPPTNPGSKTWTFDHIADFGGVTGTLLMAQPVTVSARRFFTYLLPGMSHGFGSAGSGAGSPPPPPSGTLLVPSNWRAKGANLAFNFNYGPGAAECGQWVTFPYTSWIKPQIDDAAANGVNCMRIWGTPEAVCDGHMTLSAYLANWETVLSYCNTKGIKVYPTGGDLARWSSAGNSAVISLFSSWASMLADHSNVIGVDIANECWVKCLPTANGGLGLSESSTLTFLGQLKDAINGYNLPAACSNGVTYQGGGWTLDTYLTASKRNFYNLSDFVDVHVYWPWVYQRPSGTPNGDYMSDMYTSSTLGPVTTGKDVFFGEFGALPSDSTFSTIYPGVKTLINARSVHVGGCAWAMWDYTNSSAWFWGLYSVSGFPTGPTFTRTARATLAQFNTLSTTR